MFRFHLLLPYLLQLLFRLLFVFVVTLVFLIILSSLLHSLLESLLFLIILSFHLMRVGVFVNGESNASLVSEAGGSHSCPEF